MLLTNPARESNWMLSFNLVIPGGTTVDVTQWVQNFTIPGVSLGQAAAPYGPGQFNVYGDKPEIGSLNLQFILDENWEILTILYGALFGQSRSSSVKNVVGSIVFFAMDTYNRPRFKLEYSNVVCTNISEVQMNTAQSDTNLVINATFESSGTRFRKITTFGEYSIGSGPYTKGMYRVDGTASTQEIYENDMTYRMYTGRLYKSGGVGPDGKVSEEWKVGLLEDDFYTVLATDDLQQPLEGTCGISGSRL